MGFWVIDNPKSMLYLGHRLGIGPNRKWRDTMKTLKKGEKSLKQTSVDLKSKLVTCDHASTHKTLSDGARFQQRWVLDYSDLSEEEIATAMAEYFLIAIRRRFASCDKPKAADWDNVTFDLRDFITVRQSPVEKAARLLESFTDEQLAAMGLKRA